MLDRANGLGLRLSSQWVTMSRLQPTAAEATSRIRSSGSKRVWRPTNCLRKTTRSPLERSLGMSKTIILLQITIRSSDVSFARDCCSSRAPSAKKPVETATLLFRTPRSATADLHKNLYTSVMLIDGAAMFREIGDTRRLDTVAHLHICFPCFQDCRAHLITLPTHSRWLQSCHKIDLHLTLPLSVSRSISLFLSSVSFV